MAYLFDFVYYSTGSMDLGCTTFIEDPSSLIATVSKSRNLVSLDNLQIKKKTAATVVI